MRRPNPDFACDNCGAWLYEHPGIGPMPYYIRDPLILGADELLCEQCYLDWPGEFMGPLWNCPYHGETPVSRCEHEDCYDLAEFREQGKELPMV